MFACALFLADSFVFRIEVTGSGSYLKSEALAVLQEFGVQTFRVYKGVDKPALIGKLLELPDVVFCSVLKTGSVVYLDIQTVNDSARKANFSALVAEADGTVYSMATICGTAEVAVGQQVKKGQTLIGAYTLLEDGSKQACLAVGYCKILVSGSYDFAADCESEQNLAYGKAALSLYADNVVELAYSVKKNTVGVVYEFKYTAVVTYTINFD